MAYLFGVLIILSVVSALMQGNTEALTASVLESGSEAMQFILTSGAAIIVFSGIMNIAKESGLCDLLSKLLIPLIGKILGRLDKDTQRYVTMNVACNFLGLGNAATPYGISAIKMMANGERASDRMIRFVVINTSSIQLLPTTVAAVRQSAGSLSPFDILPCVWICSVISVVTAVLACIICERVGALFAKNRNTDNAVIDNRVRYNKEGKYI